MSVADALSDPAPPFISAQSKIVPLNIATHSIDKCQEATYPGTETYTTSYDKPVLPRTKLDHDHNDRRNNGIRYTTKQVPIDKICNQNLKAIIKETDYPSTTQHQQSGIHTEGKFKAGTTHSTIPPSRQSTSKITLDTIEHRTKHPAPYVSTDTARNLVIELLKNSQTLESILREMTQFPTKILAILEPSSDRCPGNKPGFSHLEHSTVTDTKPSKTRNPNHPQPETIYQPKLEPPVCNASQTTKAVPLPQNTNTTKLDPKHSDNRDNMASTVVLITNQLIHDPILQLHQGLTPQSQAPNTVVPCSNHPPATSNASQNLYDMTPAHTRTTFAEWCKKHVSSTKAIQRLINRRRLEEIRVLVLAKSHTTPDNLHGTPHDAEFEKHHFQEHKLYALPSTGTRTKHTIPTTATYDATIALTPTQLHTMSTIRRRHVRFRQYYNRNHIPKTKNHFNAHPLHQRDKIRTAIHHDIIQTRNIWSFLQNKPPHIGPDPSDKNLLRPP